MYVSIYIYIHTHTRKTNVLGDKILLTSSPPIFAVGITSYGCRIARNLMTINATTESICYL